MARRLTSRKAREILRHGEVRGERLTAKQQRFFGAIAGGQMPQHPGRTHRSFAENVDAYDGSALGDVPPRVDVPRGSPARDAVPSATGRPAGVQTADGTENLRADGRSLAAGDGRAQASGAKRAWPSAVDSYDDAEV